MSRLRFNISISLDGFVAGPHQSVENPLGVGGMRLHQWIFPIKAWRAMAGMTGGEINESTPVIEESLANIGATIMGRNMFGGHPGQWDTTNPWTGWWGKNPPFHHSVFVLTHHARAPLIAEGGTTFYFVTDGIEAALERARQAAGEKDINLAGGGHTAQQYLNAGLVDGMELHVVPTLLGDGERLFDGTGDDLHGLELVRTIATPTVTHLKFARTLRGDLAEKSDKQAKNAEQPSHVPTRGVYGHITHTDISSGDPEATREWCTKVFGWAFKPGAPNQHGEYFLFTYSEAGGGGIRRTDPGEAAGCVPFVNVADVPAVFTAALAAGGEELQAPKRVGEGLSIALVRAPGGATIGLSGP